MTPERLRRLVKRLGHELFAERNASERELSELGLEAKPVLVTALKSSDPEIRLRARRCLAKILEDDFRNRLNAFLADKTGAGDYDLPGWRRWLRMFGAATRSRDLYAEVIQAEPGLLETVESNPSLAPEALLLCCQQIQRRQQVPDARFRRQPELGNLVALVFVGADERVKFPATTLAVVSSYINRSEFQNAMKSGPNVSYLRQLLGAWVRRDADVNVAYQNIQLSLRYNIKEGVHPALRIIRDKSAATYTKLYATLALGKLGGSEHLAALRPLLDDNQVCTTRTTIVNGNRSVFQTQVRDAALAVTIHLRGQKPKDFGFEQISSNTQTLFNSSSMGFNTDQQRKEACDKWDQWAKQHPLKPGAGQGIEAPPEDVEQNAGAGAQAAPQRANAPIAAPLAMFRLAGGKAQAQAAADADQSAFYLPDREAQQRVAAARRFIADKRYAEAVRLLDNVLGLDRGGVIRPDRSYYLFQSIWVEAQRVLGSLPPEGAKPTNSSSAKKRGGNCKRPWPPATPAHLRRSGGGMAKRAPAPMPDCCGASVSWTPIGRCPPPLCSRG